MQRGPLHQTVAPQPATEGQGKYVCVKYFAHASYYGDARSYYGDAKCYYGDAKCYYDGKSCSVQVRWHGEVLEFRATYQV